MDLATSPAEALPFDEWAARDLLDRLGRNPTPAEVRAAEVVGHCAARMLDLTADAHRDGSVVEFETFRKADRLRREALEAAEAAGLNLSALDPRSESIVGRVWLRVGASILTIDARYLVIEPTVGCA